MGADRDAGSSNQSHLVPDPQNLFPILSAPTVVEVSKLTAEAIERWGMRDVDYVVFEPFRDTLRVRPAALEDQVKYELESGLGRVTYSFGEFLDEFHDAPNNPAPTFDRLAQFKRDYRKLTAEQRRAFRAAAKKMIAPLSTHAAGRTGPGAGAGRAGPSRLPRALHRPQHARRVHVRAGSPERPAAHHLVSHRR